MANKKNIKLDDVEIPEDWNDFYYTTQKEVFTTGTSSNNTALAGLLTELNKAYKKSLVVDPTSSARIYTIIKDSVDRLSKYEDSKKENDLDYSRYLLRDMLFPWQKEYYDSIAKKITLFAGRRSGKSYSIVQKAIKHCLIPNKDKIRQAIIIGLTLEKTALLYWDNIKTALNKAHIKTKSIDNSNYTITFTNGNKLFLWGNNSKAEREKLRGFDISAAFIDECQSQNSLLYICETILGPMLKATNGELVLSGTAPLSAGTYWEQCILSDAFEHIHATMEDNPTIPNYESALQDVLKENNWTEDNITFRREYKGELAYDNNLLMYPYVTYYDNIPADFKPVKAYGGLDLGWTDANAFVIILIDAYNNGYVAYEWSESHKTDTEIFNQVIAIRDAMYQKWNIPREDVKIVCDTNAQSATRDWYNKGLVELENVRKDTIEYSRALVNEALKDGTLKILKDGPVDVDHQRGVYKYDQENSRIVYEEDKTVWHCNATEALRYAWLTFVQEQAVSD